MRIADIDYYSLYGNSWLHRIPTAFKLFAAFFILALVLATKNYMVAGITYAILIIITLTTRLPKFRILSLSLYPILFIFIYFISLRNIDPEYILLILFRALSSSTGFILIIFTTPYTKIFQKLSYILPSFLVNILFLTYRSIFILGSRLEKMILAFHIRGRFRWEKPVESIKSIANILGFLIISAIESSEIMYQSLKLRGYSDNLRYLKK